MEKIFASIFPILLFCSSLFGEIQPGTLAITRTTPHDFGGTPGSWEMDIFCPYGEVYSTGAVSVSTTDPVVLSSVVEIDGYCDRFGEV